MGEISAFDRKVYQALAAYCFGEAVCWPSQVLIGQDLGVSHSTVSRSIKRLRLAGYVKIVERWWGRRCRKLHNVYELLEPWKPLSDLVAKRIGKRALYRRFKGVHSKRSFFVSRRSEEAPKHPGGLPPGPPLCHSLRE